MNVKYDRLKLVKAERQGGGAHRYHYDYAVNGRRLSEQIPIGGSIGVFGWLGSREVCFFRQLMLKERSELPTGRVPIYICPECSDLGCGCVSVQVDKYDGCFVWSQFGYENDYEDGIIEVYEMRDMFFDEAEYRSALECFV